MNIYIVALCLIVTLVSSQNNERFEKIHKKETDGINHYEEGEHNPDFDHASFVGANEAKEFDDLPLEESKRRLGLIFDKLDTNKDGKASLEELRAWIIEVQNKYIIDDSRKQWEGNAFPNNMSIVWETYVTQVYGEVQQDDEDVKKMIKREERKWKLADTNSDNELNLEEYSGFIHPEEVKHMQDNVVVETLEDMDKDNDGKISLEEFIQDMYTKVDNEDEPEWVQNERESFKEQRDKNKDGFMDASELKSWVIPEDYDMSYSESKHLIDEADEDKDGYLTKEEVLNKHSVFVGNHVTDYGELLKHDEF